MTFDLMGTLKRTFSLATAPAPLPFVVEPPVGVPPATVLPAVPLPDDASPLPRSVPGVVLPQPVKATKK